MSDGEIIARVRAGDTAAFADLVRRHQDRVYGMALRATGRSEDAEDLAQEVFLSVFRGLEGFKGDAQFTTWLYRIAWNRCADWLRRNRKPARRTSRRRTISRTAGRTLPKRRSARMTGCGCGRPSTASTSSTVPWSSSPA